MSEQEMGANLAKYRALDTLDELLEAHRAAVESIRIVSRSEGFPDQLVVAMQTYYSFDPHKNEECKRRVLTNIDRAKKFNREDFFYQRRMLLIALCGLLDVAIKDVVAEKWAKDSHPLPKLPREFQREIERILGKVPSASRTEEIFSFVDHHFRRVKETKKRNHAERFRYWLSLVDEEPPSNADEDLIINHVFHVRNLAIHRSESARKILATENSSFWDQHKGEIRLGQKEITRCAESFRRFIAGIGFANL